MNVQEMIDQLMKIEDKTLPVCVEDWSEQYQEAALAYKPMIVEGPYKINGTADTWNGLYVSIDSYDYEG